MGCNVSKILLLNGPPGCGKDTIGEMLLFQYSNEAAPIQKFAAPIKDFFRREYCNDDYDLFEWYERRENKDRPHEALMGKTPREIQIAYSELYAKPFHREDVWGRKLSVSAKRLFEEGFKLIIVTDLGFSTEFRYLTNEFGAKNIGLLKIFREGKDFSNDSRGFVSTGDIGLSPGDLWFNGGIHNDGNDLNELEDRVLAFKKAFLDPKGLE